VDGALFQQIIGGIVRSGVIAFGAWAAAGGVTLTGTQLDQLSGVILMLAGVGWSIVQKWLAKRAARTGAVAAAVASVLHNTPVTVTETPKGQNNIATHISMEEQRAAPSVPKGIPPQPGPMML
jgi:hypothetical protein